MNNGCSNSLFFIQFRKAFVFYIRLNQTMQILTWLKHQLLQLLSFDCLSSFTPSPVGWSCIFTSLVDCVTACLCFYYWAWDLVKYPKESLTPHLEPSEPQIGTARLRLASQDRKHGKQLGWTNIKSFKVYNTGASFLLYCTSLFSYSLQKLHGFVTLNIYYQPRMRTSHALGKKKKKTQHHRGNDRAVV